MIPGPKNIIRRILEVPYSYEIGVACFVVLAGIANSIRSFDPTKRGWIGGLWITSAVGVAVLSVAKAIVQWRQHQEKQSTHELAGCLYVLYSILSCRSNDPDNRIRLTIYVPRNCTHMEQLLEYVGAKYPGRKAGRRFPISVGIVGLAFRAGRPFAAERQNEDSQLFLRELVEEWGYTEKEAKDLDESSRSYMAIPLGGDGEYPVYGVVYADSTISGFFDDDVTEILLTACLGIADYVVGRYT